MEENKMERNEFLNQEEKLSLFEVTLISMAFFMKNETIDSLSDFIKGQSDFKAEVKNKIINAHDVSEASNFIYEFYKAFSKSIGIEPKPYELLVLQAYIEQDESSND
jgi:hypothetical protein